MPCEMAATHYSWPAACYTLQWAESREAFAHSRAEKISEIMKCIEMYVVSAV